MPALLDQVSTSSKGASVPPCEERAGGRAAPPGVRLSIAHTDSLPPQTLHPSTFRTWQGAALAIIPAGTNRNPNLRNSAIPRGVRGKVTTLSSGARRRIKEALSKIAPVPAYTMALTLPVEVAAIAPDIVHRAFQNLTRNFTASTRWRHVGMIYKREFQKNGRLHYHFVAFGLTPSESKELQRWISSRWVRLILNGFPTDSPVRLKMFKVHMHSKNMELVRRSIASYFAKYLGKANDAPPVVVPGHWWGKINEAAIPTVEEKQLILPDFVRDRARRSARKLQSKRVQHALFVNAMRAANFMISAPDGKPVPAMSLQQFNQARNFFPDHFSKETPRSTLLSMHYEMRKKLLADGFRSGTHNRPRPSSFGKITLVGYGVPAIAEKIIRHAAKMWKDHLEIHPF